MAENPYKEDEMRKTTKKKVVKEVKNDIIDQVYNDGTKPSGPADINSYYSARPDLCWDPNSVYVPYVDPVVDLNDFNTQATVQIPADGGLKDDLNDIKNLLKAMNENLDKILHHLNGGWN